MGLYGLVVLYPADTNRPPLQTDFHASQSARPPCRLRWRFVRNSRARKAYRRNPSRQRKAALRARFDRIFARKTGFVTPVVAFCLSPMMSSPKELEPGQGF